LYRLAKVVKQPNNLLIETHHSESKEKKSFSKIGSNSPRHLDLGNNRVRIIQHFKIQEIPW
jgi:hypothetical protein